MPAIVPVLRWPGPAAAVALVCAAGASGAEGPAAPPSPPPGAPGAAAPVPQPEARKAPRAPKKPGKPKKVKVAGVLNLNRATEAELQLLPGIGRGRARAIVERRPKAGYRSLEEVARIKGLRRIVQRLHKQLVVEGPTTLHPVEKEPAGPAG